MRHLVRSDGPRGTSIPVQGGLHGPVQNSGKGTGSTGERAFRVSERSG